MFALERTYHDNTDESHKRIENILSVKTKTCRQVIEHHVAVYGHKVSRDGD